MYDLKSVNLPTITGQPLKLLAELLEGARTRGLLAGRLLRDAGIYQIREAVVAETPIPYPFLLTTEPIASDPPQIDLTTVLPEERPNRAGFQFQTIRDYWEQYCAGTTNPEAVAEKVWQAIVASDQQQPPLRAFIATNRQDLLAQAAASAQRWQMGKPLSILDGVPIAVKDEVDQPPYPTTVGTKFLGKMPAQTDATVVSRLRSQGALLIGKTNMHEIGIVPTGINAHHGFARNPYNPAHYSGGSSSGSAVAVAAGICPAAIGADGGGSIRIPAALCGIVGLKATFGRVSEAGAFPLCWSVAHLGPITATAEDAAVRYTANAGTDPGDPHSQKQPALDLSNWAEGNLQGLKIGVYEDWFNHAQQEVVEKCRHTLNQFQQRGATLHPITISNLELARVAHVITIASEMHQAVQAHYQQHRRDFGLDVRVNLALASLFTAYDYIQAQRVRAMMIQQLQTLFQQVEVIFTPATAVASPPITPAALPDGESNLHLLTELMRFAFLPNLTGHPAIVFPVGYNAQGMPIAAQFIGRAWAEKSLLGLAHIAEQFLNRRSPSTNYN